MSDPHFNCCSFQLHNTLTQRLLEIHFKLGHLHFQYCSMGWIYNTSLWKIHWGEIHVTLMRNTCEIHWKCIIINWKCISKLSATASNIIAGEKYDNVGNILFQFVKVIFFRELCPPPFKHWGTKVPRWDNPLIRIRYPPFNSYSSNLHRLFRLARKGWFGLILPRFVSCLKMFAYYSGH